MDTNQYMSMFLEESKEHLQTLNECLLVLESNPKETDVLDEIFRSAHTIKGMSATMGFNIIAELTHEMENVLDLLRKHVRTADDSSVELLFNCVDTLEQLVEAVANGEDYTTDIEGLIQRLKNFAEGEVITVESKTDKTVNISDINDEIFGIAIDDKVEQALIIAEQDATFVYHVKITINSDCVLKGARVYMIMATLEGKADIIKTVPPQEELESGNFSSDFEMLIATDRLEDEIKEIIFRVSEISSVEINKVKSAEKKVASPPKSVVNEEAKAQPQINKEEIVEDVLDSDKKNNAVNNVAHKVKSGQSVRVDIERLDDLLNLVGELVINKTRLAQIGATHKLVDLVDTIEQMERATTDLQTVVMKVRMVPISQVFNRFPRMVRDLSRELHKEINLVITGEETELDRTVIDEIGDPLVHLLRNAIDHGVEDTETRKKNGKNPTGLVSLIARYEGNNVIIEVSDDGKGVDAAVIREKAVEKGLMTKPEADKLDDNEAVRILFLPGFSTAEKVTDVSGRGVGMDAVKTKIEALAGNVDIVTVKGKGSTFKIRLPLTLAIIQALLVSVSDEIYAIPLASIDSTININCSEIKMVQNKEVILLRGQIIPILRLAEALNVPVDPNKETQEDIFVVVVQIGNQKCGIIVDNLIGQQEIVIKSLGKLMTGIKIIAGATILGNGQVALILDVGSLI